MNAIPCRLAAGLLVLVAPIALAQQPTRPAPADPPATGEAEKEHAKDATRERRLRSEIDRSVDAIRSFSSEQRDEALARARRGAEELDRQMQQLDEDMSRDWARMGQAARTRAQATMSDLRQQRNTMAEWYGGLRHAATASWSEVRGGFVDSYHVLADRLGEARDEFRQHRAPDEDVPRPAEAQRDAPDKP